MENLLLLCFVKGGVTFCHFDNREGEVRNFPASVKGESENAIHRRSVVVEKILKFVCFGHLVVVSFVLVCFCYERLVVSFFLLG